MNNRRNRRVGREAIEMLKDYYANGGGQFDGSREIVAWFRSHRIKAGIDQVRGWDRQARLERADQMQATTFPTRRNGYVRQAAPTHTERVIGRVSRLKDTHTRIVNDEREAKAEAAQADASAIERARVEMVAAAKASYRALTILGED